LTKDRKSFKYLQIKREKKLLILKKFFSPRFHPVVFGPEIFEYFIPNIA